MIGLFFVFYQHVLLIYIDLKNFTILAKLCSDYYVVKVQCSFFNVQCSIFNLQCYSHTSLPPSDVR